MMGSYAPVIEAVAPGIARLFGPCAAHHRSITTVGRNIDGCIIRLVVEREIWVRIYSVHPVN